MAHFHTVLTLRMSGAILYYPCMHSWHGQRKLYLFTTSQLTRTPTILTGVSVVLLSPSTQLPKQYFKFHYNYFLPNPFHFIMHYHLISQCYTVLVTAAHFNYIYRISRTIRRATFFSLDILGKNNDECILILVIYWKKTGLVHTKISNHNLIYSS